jgi:hypothetical protein
VFFFFFYKSMTCTPIEVYSSTLFYLNNSNFFSLLLTLATSSICIFSYIFFIVHFMLLEHCCQFQNQPKFYLCVEIFFNFLHFFNKLCSFIIKKNKKITLAILLICKTLLHVFNLWFGFVETISFIFNTIANIQFFSLISLLCFSCWMCCLFYFIFVFTFFICNFLFYLCIRV